MGQSVLVSVLGFFFVPHPATRSKMIFVSTLAALLPMLGILLVGVTVHICCMTYLAAFGLVAITITFPVNEMNLIITCCYGSSPFDLCWLKSFTVILCSLACWRRAAFVMSSLFFFDLTHF